MVPSEALEEVEFVATDVETANADLASICQIGIARYTNGILSDEWKTYVDPEDYFDPVNTAIHGIDETTVEGAPKLTGVFSSICQFLDDRVCVCHTHFDRVALQQAFDKYDLRYPTCRWLDSARVARRTWEEFSIRGYGLASVCEHLGYTFNHHDALEDAKAAAFILSSTISKTGLDIESWLTRVRYPIGSDQENTYAITREGNPEGPLYGEVLVFTGALEIPRREAADMAARLGCRVASGVTKNTTVLVVGDQDIRKLAGHEQSSKHRKARALISRGQSIRVLKETDFKELARLAK